MGPVDWFGRNMVASLPQDYRVGVINVSVAGAVIELWDKDNWQDLLADLLIDTKSHFLGSLILKQHEQGTGKTKHVSVIDGQQRLTTLSILVKVLPIIQKRIYLNIGRSEPLKSFFSAAQ